MDVKTAVPKHSVVAQPTEGGAVLMDADTGDCFELNRTGAEIWERLRRGEAPGHIASELARAHSLERRVIEQDVLALLQSLARLGLVVVSPPAS